MTPVAWRDVGPLRCAPSPREEGTWHYLPRQPDVRRGQDGRPAVTFLGLGPSAYLVLNATWGASLADLAALAEHLATHEGAVAPRLSFAPVTVRECRLLLGPGDGGLTPFATSATSGYPPYDAVFNLLLQDEAVGWAREALGGTAGHLALEYDAALRRTVSGRATLDARADAVARWQETRPASGESRRELLEDAVRDGVAVVSVEAPEDQLGELATALYDRVLDHAASLWPGGPESAVPDLHVSVALHRDVDEPIRPSADIGSLVATEPAAVPPGGCHAENR